MQNSSWNRKIPTGIYMFKFNSGKTRTLYEICLNMTKRHQNDINRHFSVFIVYFWADFTHCSDVFIANFEQISHIVLMFPLLTLNK